MTLSLLLGLGGLLVLVSLGGALHYRRTAQRRAHSMRTLVELAERLEGDLKRCRSDIQQAYTVLSIHPDSPAHREQEARSAIDAGLRSLLQQRIWIRDRAGLASQQELDEAVATLRQAGARLAPLQQALHQAQHELDSAMRQHLQRDHQE